MSYPPKPICEHIAKLWVRSRDGSSSASERAAAFAALKRLQGEHDLSDVELTFIAELYAKGDLEERAPDLLQLLLHFFEASHIILPLTVAITVALWVLHAHVFDKFLHTPRLLLRSSELYRNDVLVSFIDDGHRQGGSITRLINREVVRYPCFCPLALAVYQKPQNRRPVADQVLSRCITLDILKDVRGRDELWPNDPRFSMLRGLISEWAGGFRRPENFKVASRILTGRVVNNWQPLLEIAETLGYGATALAVAETIERATVNPTTELFWDLQRIFEPPGVDRFWTGELLEALHQLEGSHWDEFLGIDGDLPPHKLTKAEFYAMLRTRGIRSTGIWKGIGKQRRYAKGFYKHQFEPVWRDLFPDTPTQMSKIIRLPRYSKRHSGEEN